MSAAPEQVYQPPIPPTPEPAPRAPRPTKLRPVAIALFVIGLLLIVGHLVKLLPGGAYTGAAFAIWGIALFGLSFVPLPRVETNDPPLSTFERLSGIFFEPTRVFRDLRPRPKWVAAFIVVALLSVAYTALFVRRVTPERIANFTIDKVAESGFIPPDRVEQQRQIRLEQAKNPINQAMELLTSIPLVFLKYGALAAVLMLGVVAFGGRMNYWQAFAAVIFAILPWTVIHKVLSIVLLYLKSPDDIHPILNQHSLLQDNLSILVSPAEHPVLFVLASVAGLTFVYWVWLTAKGLQFTATKVSGSAAWGVTITVTLLMIASGVISALLFSGFMS